MSDTTLKLKSLAVGVLVVAGLLGLVRTIRHQTGREVRWIKQGAGEEQAAAYRLGRAVAADHAPGKLLVIRVPGLVPETEALERILTKGVERGLDGRGWKIVALPPEDLAPEAVGPWALRTTTGDWGREFREWAAPHPDAVAVLSLVGVPKLTDAEWGRIPPFYGTSFAMSPYLAHLLKTRRIAGLAVPRADVDPVTIRGFRGPLDELFDLAYELHPER